jgi:subtilisin family serine protease
MPGEPPIGSEIGVAPRLPVIPCRVVTSVVLAKKEQRQAVADGIRHAITKGCAAVSISLGIPLILNFGRNHMGLAVDAAYEAGVVVVAAGGQIVDSVCYPAKFNRTIGVGGVTPERRIWFDYRAGRDEIDVWAPAKDVLREDSLAPPGAATLPPVEGADPGAQTLSGRSDASSSSAHSGKSGPGSGTSYATVHVAAAAAMWLRHRAADIARTYDQPWQQVEAFRLLLRKTGGPVSGTAPSNGTGILNIEALLRASLPPAGDLRKAPEDKGKWQ